MNHQNTLSCSRWYFQVNAPNKNGLKHFLLISFRPLFIIIIHFTMQKEAPPPQLTAAKTVLPIVRDQGFEPWTP